MLTRPGRTVLVVSLGLVVAGRLLGVSELWLVGTAGFLLTAAAALWVRVVRLRIDTVRTVNPRRLHAGASITIELEVTNRGERTTPVLQLRDFAAPAGMRAIGLGVTGPTLLNVPPLRAGEAVRTSYTVRCGQRGIATIGPLEIVLSDPFGLVALTVQRSVGAELVVWPALQLIGAPTFTRSSDDGPRPAATPPSFSGSDLVGLRPYLAGDDLRHVHWRASARYDDLMVRQLESPPDDLTTVILDTRASTHTHSSFEQALSATTSILVACARRDARVRLLITSNPANADLFDSGAGSGDRFTESLLDELAVVQPNPTASLPATLAGLRTAVGRGVPGATGHAAVLVGGNAHDLVPVLTALGGASSEVVAVAFTGPHERFDVDPRMLVIDGETSFEQAWSRAIGSRP